MATRYVDSHQKNNENRGQLQLSADFLQNFLRVALGEALWACCRVRFRHQSFHKERQSTGLYHRRSGIPLRKFGRHDVKVSALEEGLRYAMSLPVATTISGRFPLRLSLRVSKHSALKRDYG